MYDKLSRLLGNIVGRIKEMAQIYLAFGALLMPMGVVILIEKPEWIVPCTILLIVGAISAMGGLFLAFKEEWKHQAQIGYFYILIKHIAMKLGVEIKAVDKEWESLSPRNRKMERRK